MKKTKGISIFQALIISYMAMGVAILTASAIGYFIHERRALISELKVRFDHDLGNAKLIFDDIYTAQIRNDIDFIEKSSAVNDYLSSAEKDLLITKTEAEQAFLNITRRSPDVYISARFINPSGEEQIISSGTVRLHNYSSLAFHPDDALYSGVYSLFNKLKTAQPGVILFEGPFKYGSDYTFLIGSLKSEPEIGGFGGAVIFHCSLKNYFAYLGNIVSYNQRIVRVYDANGVMLFPYNPKDIDYAKPLYMASKALSIGQNGKPMISVVYAASPRTLEVLFKDIAKSSAAFILIGIVIIAAIAFVIASYFTRAMTVFVSYVDNIGKGDLSARVHIRSPRELAVLANSFNNMAEGLQKTTVSVDRLTREIKERQKAEEQLQETQAQLTQSSKMAAVGQLAGGVAHEINNPLTGVLNNVQLIRMMIDSNNTLSMEELKSILLNIEESAQRCKKITQSLLDFSHASKKIFEEICLNDLTEKVCELISHEMSLQNVEIKKDLEASLPKIKGDVQLLQQVLFGLIGNAKWAIDKAGKEKGAITIKTWRDDTGSMVNMTISDNGIGISDENLSKIFEPFFTTKQVGEGTGLGLSLAYNIIKNHNGTIAVSSQPGIGTTVRISIPFQA